MRELGPPSHSHLKMTVILVKFHLNQITVANQSPATNMHIQIFHRDYEHIFVEGKKI